MRYRREGETYQQWEMMSKVRHDEHSCHCRVPLSVPATTAAAAASSSSSSNGSNGSREIGRTRFVMIAGQARLVMMQKIHKSFVGRSEHEIRMTGARHQLRSGRHFGRSGVVMGAQAAGAETRHRSRSVTRRRRGR